MLKKIESGRTKHNSEDNQEKTNNKMKKKRNKGN